MKTQLPTTRDKILSTAERLIYQQGIQATSLDALVKVSGVARKSIYHHFTNKDDIAIAVLDARDDRWMHWFCEETEKAATPHARLIEMFNVLASWFASPEFYGCAFINTACEIGDAEAPVRAICKRHKQRLLSYVQHLCEQAGCAEPEPLARQLLILIDGAITVARVTGDIHAAESAKSVALALLQPANVSTTP
ncbi:TetR/AcrR family transcriptional regulator [Kosakonia sp. BYX6]|uniref:TetR/AcrR family transcriptional regulator n=1 Tax=Kosakonia calanthes TaxID=3139408 RepID=A0ABZ3BA63_9ENTR